MFSEVEAPYRIIIPHYKKLVFFQAYHYERYDVALYGYAKFMKEQSAEEREHAMKLMKVSDIIN